MKEFNLEKGIKVSVNGQLEDAFIIEMHEANMSTFDIYDEFKSKYNDLVRLMSKQSNNLSSEDIEKARVEQEGKELKGSDFIDMMNIMGSDFNRKDFFKAFNKLCDTGLIKVEGSNLNGNLRSKMDVKDYYRLVGEYVVSFFMTEIK